MASKCFNKVTVGTLHPLIRSVTVP
jgi:hypothetical protein